MIRFRVLGVSNDRHTILFNQHGHFRDEGVRMFPARAQFCTFPVRYGNNFTIRKVSVLQLRRGGVRVFFSTFGFDSF